MKGTWHQPRCLLHSVGMNLSVCAFGLQVHIHEANGSVYAATVDNKVAMKIGPGVWDPHGAGIHVGQTSWHLSISGTSFAVWEAKF